MIRSRLAAALAAGFALAGGSPAATQDSGGNAAVIPARAESPAATPSVSGPTRGPVTSLPIPRYVSMKASEANVRRGPSLTHRIDWIYRHKDLPLRITAEHGHWRRVEDAEGAGGWIHYSLLSGVRTVLVQDEGLALRMKPLPDAPAAALAERNVVARLGDCMPDWCHIRAGRYRGWVRKSALWGVSPDEIRD